MEKALLDRMEQDVLVALRGARLYITTRERNAWHSTTSRRYKGPTSLSTSLSGAMRTAEEWRAMGSSFSIQQVPGVLLIGETMRVAMVEFQTDNSFEGWFAEHPERLIRGTNLRSVQESLGHRSLWNYPHPSEHSWVTGTLAAKARPQALSTGRFVRWDSFTEGKGEDLGWQPRVGRHEPRGVQRIVRRYQKVNSAAKTAT